ncbi:unnamed protein product [Tuber aestivum]|uniref:Major facilitator superfamily (MFS) profile domain-containing protein n=1 Tax=Tuber aestivum TaxID=59557 RepID=A0A292PX02_9PEZI|nr:unnamed protein product [Tuber aestivum]
MGTLMFRLTKDQYSMIIGWRWAFVLQIPFIAISAALVSILVKIREKKPEEASLRLTPFAIGTSTGSLEAGPIINATRKYYILGQTVMLKLVQGVLPICAFRLTTPLFPNFFNLFTAGAGYGGTLTVALLALISSADHSELAAITSANYELRSKGSTIGTTVGSSIFRNVLVRQLRVHLGSEKEGEGIIRRLRERFDEFDRLSEVWKGKAALEYMDALHAVLWTAPELGVLAFQYYTQARQRAQHKTLDRK